MTEQLVLYLNSFVAAGLCFLYTGYYKLFSVSNPSAKFFLYIGIGWFFNVAYLAWSSFSPGSPVTPNFATSVTLILDGLTHTCFIAASRHRWTGRGNPPPNHFWGVRVRGVHLAIAFALLTAFAVSAFVATGTFLVPDIISMMLAMVGPGMIAFSYDRYFRATRKVFSSPTRVTLVASMWLYAALQLAVLLPVEWITVWPFWVGLVLKALHLVGLADFGAALIRDYQQAFVDREELSRLMRSTRATAGMFEQLAHEIHTPALELRLRLAQLETRFSDAGLDASQRGHLVNLVEQISSPVDVFQRHSVNLRGTAEPVEEGLYNMNNICDEAITHLKQVMQPRATIEKRYASGPTVVGQRGAMFQIVRNLVKNSIEAIACRTDWPSQEKGHIAVSTQVTGGNGNRRVIVRVEDNGVGIPTEVKDRMFDDGVSTKAGRGRGHGLYIVKGFVERSGGRIVASNASTGGAVFEIDLPYVPQS